MKIDVSLEVNGSTRRVSVEPTTMLSAVLREYLLLTGTKEACGLGECGSCAVLIDGKAVNSCCLPAVDAEGSEILTIEGLSTGGITSLQQAFVDHGAIHCGFCTPGFVMTAHDLLTNDIDHSREAIKRAVEGNICRCTGYLKILSAIEDAAVAPGIESGVALHSGTTQTARSTGIGERAQLPPHPAKEG